MHIGRTVRFCRQRIVMVGLATLFVVAPAYAEREYEFAKGLWDRGYLDLAIAQYQKLLTMPGVSAAQKSNAHFDLATIYQEQADRAKTAAERQPLMQKARAELADALKAAGDDVVLTFKARQQQALLLQNNGRYLAALLERSDFAGDRDATRKAAEKAFADSVTAFRTLSKDAEALIAKVEKQRRPGAKQLVDKLQFERVHARLLALWSEYYAALLFDEKTPDRRARLEKAAEAFAQFAKDWDGTLFALYGYLGEGQCRLALGDHEKAQAKFGTVLRARGLKIARDACVKALIQRATSYNATDQAALALEDLDAALKFFPRPERVEIGRQALIEKAKAQEQLAQGMRAGDPDSPEWQGVARQALQSARQVAERPGVHDREALRLITRLLVLLGPETASTAAECLAVAEAALERKEYEAALDGYRRAVELAKRRDAPVAVSAWYGIGRCYYYRRLFREAAIAFEFVGREFPQSPEGPRAAYLGVQCWSLAYSESRRPAELEATTRSLERALERYRGHPQVADLRALQGRMLIQDRRHDEALSAFQAVPEGSPGYVRAQYDAGMCAWDWFLDLLKRNTLGDDGGRAQYETAVKHLRTYLGLVKTATMTAEQKDRVGRARVILATIYGDIIGQPKQALAFIEGFEFPQDLRGQVLPVRLKALIQLERVDEALVLLKEAKASTKADPERFKDILGLLAKAMDDQAEALRKKGDEAAYRAAARRTADFLLTLIRDDPGQDAGMYQFVALRLIQIGRFKEAADILTRMIARFGTEKANEDVVIWARLRLVDCLMGTKEWTRAVEQLIALRKRGGRYGASEELKEMLGAAYVESGQPNEGIPLLRELFRDAQTTTYQPGTKAWFEVGHKLGTAYEAIGRPDLALKITGYVKVLYASFWRGEDRDLAALAAKYKELHKRCGGKA